MGGGGTDEYSPAWSNAMDCERRRCGRGEWGRGRGRTTP